MTGQYNIKIKNRLGELMKQPGGRSIAEALQGAEKRFDKISDQCLAALDRSIARMEAAAAELNETPDAKAAAEIYQASNDMIAMAGLVGYAALDEVAHGLCDLIDVLRAEGQWSDQAIKVHVDAVVLLRGMDKKDKAAPKPVMDGLRKIWIRFGVIEAPEPAAEG